MRLLAIFLSVIAVGLYAWPVIMDNFGKVDTVQEVFPQMMQEIRPVNNVQSALEKPELESPLPVASQENTEPTLDAQAPIASPAEQEPEVAEVVESFCVRLGPISVKRLPAINRSLELQKLLERVSVEPILGRDHWVVFVIPSSTNKGAQAQANQMKRLGYKSAVPITDGPLLNGVSLDTFSNEEQALAFLKKVQEKTKMQGIRVTRMIGQPTNDVYLIFSNISQEQKEKVATIGRHHKQQLSTCF